MATIRLTMAQALVRYLMAQDTEVDSLIVDGDDLYWTSFGTLSTVDKRGKGSAEVLGEVDERHWQRGSARMIIRSPRE